MRITFLAVQNYKSLKAIELRPQPFSILLGPNAAGKSNFTDSIDFLAIAYQHGLEYAIARKGGYDNIAFRRIRRTKDAIRFTLGVTLEAPEIETLFAHSKPLSQRDASVVSNVFFRHTFAFRAKGESIKSDFEITDEELSVYTTRDYKDLLGQSTSIELRISRDKDGNLEITSDKHSPLASALSVDPNRFRDINRDLTLTRQELAVSLPIIGGRLFRIFTGPLAQMSVFRISPEIARVAGVPTPNPSLTERGENLPAVVDWLQRRRPDRWKRVMTAMRELIPGLTEISVRYLHTKAIGLFFQEENVGQPWTADDVSDGTIRVLAILVAAEDPRTSVLVIEEPEVSVHPWIVRVLVNHLRQLSLEKTVLVTTHSMNVLDQCDPKEVWVVYRRKGQTSISALTSLDSAISTDWESGKYRLSEFLDSGSIEESVPNVDK